MSPMIYPPGNFARGLIAVAVIQCIVVIPQFQFIFLGLLDRASHFPADAHRVGISNFWRLGRFVQLVVIIGLGRRHTLLPQTQRMKDD